MTHGKIEAKRIRTMTGVGLAAAFAALVGCSEDRASYADQDQDRLPTTPATEQAAPPGYSGQTGLSQSGTGQGGTDQTGTTQPETGQLESSDIERTEFAAFDTNSDGMLTEREFDSDDARSQVSLKNMSFAQIDQNADGSIDAQEFESARAVSDPDAPRGLTLDERPRE